MKAKGFLVLRLILPVVDRLDREDVWHQSIERYSS